MTNLPTLKQGVLTSVKSLTSWSPEANPLQLCIYSWLVFGLVLLYSASLPQGLKEEGSAFFFILRQVTWMLVGLVCFEGLIRTPLSFWWRKAPFMFFSIFLAVLATQVIGRELNGADRWLPLGPFSFQPSEIAKPLLILQAVWVLDRWSQMQRWMQLTWVVLLLLLVAAVASQPSLSMALLMGIVLWLLGFGGGLPLRALVGSLCILGVLVGGKILTTSYQSRRIFAFLDPFANAQGDGYQGVQSLLAVGSGGLWGAGYGMSAQKIDSLPFAYSDFVFAVFAEEFGLVGVLGFLGFLCLFGWLGLRLSMARSAPRSVRLLALGTTLMLTVQSLLHLGVVASSLPPTGMPLPFVSYGGSGILAALITAGLLVRAAREAGPVRLDTGSLTNPGLRIRRKIAKN